MSLDLFETILSLAEDAGEAALVDAVLLPLLALPAVAALVLSVFGSFLPQMRAPFLRALRPVRLFAFGAALALLLFGGAPLRPALGVLLLAVLASYLLAAPLFLPVRRSGEARRGRRSVRPEGKKTKGRAADVRREEGAARRVVVEKDVRLGHIFSTLERLRDLPLSAGDRLEAQKTEELLTVYRAKGTLTSAEAETLNDILAALLKMMAKYKM